MDGCVGRWFGGWEFGWVSEWMADRQKSTETERKSRGVSYRKRLKEENMEAEKLCEKRQK